MYAKNSTQILKSMNYNEKDCDNIINTFKELKKTYNTKNVSISYFIKKLNLSIEFAYDLFNYLIEIDKIEIVEISTCSNCGNENYNINKNIMKCVRCKDSYFNNELSEKFRLKDF